jgi:hypothetical protein
MQRLIGILLLLGLAGCGQATYEPDRYGQFSGGLVVYWVGETERGMGDGTFVLVPTRNDPLTYRTAPGSGWQGTIQPGIMYTDGGSIPQIAQAIPGLSPWGYAPAFMVHDWLYVARHCLTDGATDAEYLALKDVTFADSADLMGQAISAMFAQGLVRENPSAATGISSGVNGLISRQAWDAKGRCATDTVSEERKAAIRSALSGGLRTFARSAGPEVRLITAFTF